MNTAGHEVLASMDFPKVHGLQNQSTNPLACPGFWRHGTRWGTIVSRRTHTRCSGYRVC